MVPVDEALYKKLAGIFPSLNEDELRFICKKNYNNELAVMGDLSARGYRPIVPNGSETRLLYSLEQNRSYTPHQYTGHIVTTSPTQTSTSTTSITAPMTTTNGTSSVTAVRTINTDITNAHNKNPALVAAKVSNSSPTPALANNSTSTMSDRSNSPKSYWCINTAKRTYSPIVGKTVTRPNPVVIQQSASDKNQTPNGSSAQSKGGGRYYYPGRFVQGVGFEPNSMGGAPRVTGKPFVPLQGRYVFGGMINDRSYSPKPQTKSVITRDPNYGSGHQNQDLYQPTISPPPPPNPPPISLAVYAAYAKQAEAAGMSSTTSSHRSSPVHYPARPPYSGPIPSWYGEEERISTPIQRLHHDFIRNRITDRSASPPIVAPIRTYSIFAPRDRSTPPPSSTSSSPYHHYHSTHHQPVTGTTANSGGGGGGSSFYATASRLYTQSPKPPLRSANTVFNNLIPASTSSTTSVSVPAPYPHYHGPVSRPQISPSPPATPLVITTSTPPNYYSPCPSPASFIIPAPLQSRTYSPIPPSTDGYPPYPVRSSPAPGSHSPKIKLRYLRRIYPGVDETILLDVLANSDNNIQTAMQELGTLGYVKIETPPVRPSNTSQNQQQSMLQKAVDAFRDSKPSTIDKDRPVAPPRRMTEADKQKTRARMLEKVQEVSADILTIALESVNFDEDKALVLLNFIKLEESRKNEANERVKSEIGVEESTGLLANLENHQIPIGSAKPVAPIRTSQKAEQTEKIQKEGYVFRSRYKSDVKGPNNYLRKGPNPELLSKDGKTSRHNAVSRSKGPNKDLLYQPTVEEDPSLIIPKVKDRLNYNQIATVENILNRGASKNKNIGPQQCLVQGSTYKIPV